MTSSPDTPTSEIAGFTSLRSGHSFVLVFLFSFSRKYRHPLRRVILSSRYPSNLRIRLGKLQEKQSVGEAAAYEGCESMAKCKSDTVVSQFGQHHYIINEKPFYNSPFHG